MLFEIMLLYGILPIIVSATRKLYDRLSARVLVDGKLNETIDITSGVLQGDTLARILFILVLGVRSEQQQREIWLRLQFAKVETTSSRKKS